MGIGDPIARKQFFQGDATQIRWSSFRMHVRSNALARPIRYARY